MIITKGKAELKKALEGFENSSIGFVPTMGALHMGHLSLLDECNKQCDVSVVSIFVNPTQFNDKDDFNKYPITLESDINLLTNGCCDILFIPSVEEIYGNSLDNKDVIDFGLLATVMEGAFRPGHFDGVAQIVNILLDLVNADKAFFGQKDFQQLAIIKFLVEYKSIRTKIISCPTVREIDGLAMSSRNVRLSLYGRKTAASIFSILKESVNSSKIYSVEEVKKDVIEKINKIDLFKLEYFDIVNAKTLQSVDSWNEDCGVVGCIALFCENVRLIDNIIYN